MGWHPSKRKYNKVSTADKLAESWELSCHPAGPSVIANGPAKGETLEQYLEKKGMALLGTKGKDCKNFPIMIKLIDAKDNLSVQVHPDDAYALKNEGELGKTEMWYVIDAEPGAELLYGVEKEITRQELADSLKNGTITEICHHAPVKRRCFLYSSRHHSRHRQGHPAGRGTGKFQHHLSPLRLWPCRQ